MRLIIKNMPKFETLHNVLGPESGSDRNLSGSGRGAGEPAAAEAGSGLDKWWNSSDPFELAWGQLSEPVLMTNFSKFHQAVETVLGRKVSFDELQDPETLKKEISEFRKKKAA